MQSFDEYQKESSQFAIYPEAHSGQDIALAYVALGLSSEAGEVAGKIKKMVRDETFDPDAVAGEVADCLWYIAQLASELGRPLSQLARDNMHKLQSRKERGVLGGNGDNR